MKKYLKIIFSLLMVCCAMLAPFANVGKQNTASALASPLAVDTSAYDEIMRDIKITQDGYVFSTKDFEVKYNANQTFAYYYLYVNTSITITHLSSVYDLQITTNVLGDSYTTNKKLDINDSFSIEFNGTTETIYEVSLYQWRLSGTGKTFKFYLVQTPVNFKVKPPYKWIDKDNKTVIAPSANDSYLNSITLTGIKGTQNSPVYVDFYFNGEFYSVYNIDGVFYNTITNNQIKETELNFNIPGQYEVYLYDKTCISSLKGAVAWQGTDKECSFKAFNPDATNYSSYANCEYFAFSVQQSNANLSEDNMYIIAKDDQGNTIVSNQTVNSSVNIKFYNLDVQTVSKVEVLKYYSSLSGTNVPTTEVLYPGKFSRISDLNNATISYSDDSSYAINIYDRSGNAIWKQNFKFTILKDIHSSYGSLSSTDRNIVPENNKIYSISQTELHETNFAGFNEIVNASTPDQPVALQSSTTTNYVVQLARANSSLDGVSSGESVNGSVDLTVSGVGTIKVSIYRDGRLVETKNLMNGDTLTQDVVGNYEVITVDQMGTTLSKTFTINRSLNAATIALIVIGSIGLLILIIMIVRTRTRIKVR